MKPMFQTKESKRRDELKDLLNLEVVPKRDYFHKAWRIMLKHYKVILISLFIIVSALRYIFYYNSFTVMYQQVTNARAQIESALQMRQNLVPALTVVVYQFITHENNVFLKTVEAREKTSTNPKEIDALKKNLDKLASGELSPKALSNFVAVAENYPQLVSSQSYQLLIVQISDIENQIYQKRQEYNNEVNIFNTKISVFPGNLFSGAMRFKLQPYFEWGKESEWIFTSRSDEGELPVNMKMDFNNSKQGN